MIKTFTVENFCSFERFEVRDMRRLNLLEGDSGSGKTALLEAIYLAMGVSPELALRIRAWRNQETFQLSAERPHVDSLWKDLFTSSIRTELVFISFRHNVRWLHVLAQAKECRMPHFTAARALGALQFGDLRPGCPA
jgi:AAA15 family ATPase/GTPase